MTNTSNTQHRYWSDQGVDRSLVMEVTSSCAALENERHAAGWRRNGLFTLVVVVFLLALKVLFST